MLGPVVVAQTDTLGTTVGTVPGTVHGVVRKACSTASQAPTSIAIGRSLWRPIQMMIGGTSSTVNPTPTRGVTGGSSSGVSRFAFAAAVRSVNREEVCPATCTALSAGLQGKAAVVAF